jgi:hypothetical protein
MHRLLLLALWSSVSLAESDETPLAVPRNLPIPDLKRLPTYDGIDPRSADRFWESWRLVTIRSRKDNDQLRFVYANDQAWRALVRGDARYPDGAMFGKVAFLPTPDPIFPSSQVPTQFLRIQLMKKDAKGHPLSDGWAYAVYTQQVTEAPPAATQKDTTRACHACHRLAAARDFVFSEPVFSARRAVGEADGGSSYARSFERRDWATLTPFERQAVASLGEVAGGPVMVASMPLFRGSLGESIGSVGGFSAHDGLPYLLVDEDSGLFLVARPLPGRADCPAGAQFFVTVQGPGLEHELKGGEVCNGHLVWKERRRLP